MQIRGRLRETRDPRRLTRWAEINRRRGVRPVMDPEAGPENK